MRLSRFPHQHRDRDIRPLELEGVKLAGGLHGLHLGLVLIEASPQIHQLLLLLLPHLHVKRHGYGAVVTFPASAP